MHARELFDKAFDEELAELKEKGLDPREFRAGSRRATKANPNPSGEDEAWWRAEGPLMVQNWIDWRRKAGWHIWTTPDNKPAIELVLEAEIAGRPLRAIVDRVMILPNAGSLIIVDLKAGKRSPESDLQLAIYRHALSLIYPKVNINYAGYWMARKGDVEVVSLLRYHPQMIEAWFHRYHDSVERGNFIPHQSSMCRACGLRKYCAAYGGKDSHLDPDSPDYEGEETKK